MNWVLHIRKKARKAINRFPKKDKEFIARALRDMTPNPFSGDIEKLEGEGNLWRRRVGAFRIFYEIMTAEKVIHIFRVERRTSKTY